MKKNIFSAVAIAVVAAAISSFSVSAQPSFAARNQESAASIKKAPLFVVASEKDERAAKKLSKKPDDLKKYLESIDVINECLKKAVTSNWDISTEVKYISKAQAEEFSRSKASGFVLKVIEVNNYKTGDFYMIPGNGAGTDYSGLNRAYHFANAGKTVALAIAPADQQTHYVVESYLPTIGISQLAFTYMVKHLKNQVIDGANGLTKFSELKDEMAKRRDKLKEKTLLLFDPLISKPLQKAIDGGIKKTYEYPCEVSTIEAVEKAVDAKDGKYAFIWVTQAAAVSRGGESFNYYVIDAEDCRPLFISGTSVVGSRGEFHPYTLGRVSKKMD